MFEFGRLSLSQVGKGLLKDENAQKLALQHWLEAIDPRHWYGHNLHCYYNCWLHSESKQPFFYWPHLKKSYISLRKNSKLKERKLLGSRKSCKHNYKLNRPHLKKTKVCCARPKRK
ncbi:IQ domain-containing protein IQM6 isoform X2 [Zea mays]|uniref:IQ domain-containing protein IQM6 isoform X2 n=1 Tax=Zea mays TaxID=4577 RepID=UPI0002217F73|nr:IQ domain-containing protein IQM6 isoform X2 [Zea mays]|eukprot:XP_020401310.1 IQ domain-containing protein IQM6 isoform X2 [Zea mays]